MQSGQVSIGSIASAPIATIRPHPSVAQIPPPIVASEPSLQEEISTHVEIRPVQPLPIRKASPLKAQEKPIVGIPISGNNTTEAMTSSDIQSDSDKPSLTVQQVKAVWSKVLKRTDQKSSSGTMVAMLRQFEIIDIEGTADQPVVVIKTEKQAHFNYVKDKDRYKNLEWALTMEFGRQCRVRLVPPGQSLFPPAGNTSTYSANTTFTVAPQQSAHIERPDSAPPAPPKSLEQESIDQPTRENKFVPEKPVDDPPRDGLNLASAPPLARTSIVRENTTVVVPQESIEQKARRDPVVQEVMKTFTAKIVEIRPK